MNFQEKVFEVAATLRARSLALANTALETARERAQDAAKRAATLQGSLATLRVSGRALDKVVRRHAARFVKENTTIARAARKEVSALARDTYSSFARSGEKKQAAPTRKSASSRKRTRAKISA
jgi:hypothetical protein